MIFAVGIAFLAGALVGLSRQINGRLAVATSPLTASFWNHIVGFVALAGLGLVAAGLWPEGVAQAPLWVWLGGPAGVVFVAAGSWLIMRIGAAQTALMVIAGQMVFGVVLDLISGAPGAPWARTAGVALIIAGAAVTARAKDKS